MRRIDTEIRTLILEFRTLILEFRTLIPELRTLIPELRTLDTALHATTCERANGPCDGTALEPVRVCRTCARVRAVCACVCVCTLLRERAVTHVMLRR
jgi:hypothetical protein